MFYITVALLALFFGWLAVRLLSTLYTGFGAGIWGAILAGTGFFIGRSTTDLSYEELVPLGKQLVSEHYWWIILLIALFLAGYWILSKYVMKKS